jgi:hypothetical protein
MATEAAQTTDPTLNAFSEVFQRTAEKVSQHFTLQMESFYRLKRLLKLTDTITNSQGLPEGCNGQESAQEILRAAVVFGHALLEESLRTIARALLPDRHLERTTYNNKQDIRNLLKSLGFKPSKHAAELRLIEKMMKRRHFIVHRADRIEGDAEPGSLIGPLRSISTAEVADWLDATQRLMLSLHSALWSVFSNGAVDMKPGVGPRLGKGAPSDKVSKTP